MTQIIITGICAKNEGEISSILALVGCKGADNLVNEITSIVSFNPKHTTQDEIAVTIGRLILAGLEVAIA